MTERVSTEAGPDATTEGGMKCDFCDRVVPSVQRVALDGDYERLRTRHTVLYSCPECFDKKERERLARNGGSSAG